MSIIDERFWACTSRATGLVLLDLLQFDCGVVGRSAAHLSGLDASVAPATATAAADVSSVSSRSYAPTYLLYLGANSYVITAAIPAFLPRACSPLHILLLCVSLDIGLLGDYDGGLSK